MYTLLSQSNGGVGGGCGGNSILGGIGGIGGLTIANNGTMVNNNGNINGSAANATASSLEYVLDHNELHNFATQIARGMRHLHEHQITHR